MAGIFSLDDAVKLVISRNAASSTTFNVPRLTFVSTSGEIVTKGTVDNAAFWLNVISIPPSTETFHAMQKNCNVFVDVSPQSALFSSAQAAVGETTELALIGSCLDTRDEFSSLCSALTGLFCANLDIKWKSFFDENVCQKLQIRCLTTNY